jgi:hypothetical protein
LSHFEEPESFVYGGGFGSRASLGPIDLEMDLSVRSGIGDMQMIMPVLRLDAGLKLGETALFAGVSAFGVSDEILPDGQAVKDTWMVNGSESVFSFGTFWGTDYDVVPKFFAGFRF